MKIKTTNALMKYLRDTHNISICDSKDKRNLINIGYYHGYKGYRYINNPQNRIKISNFNEIVSIVDFGTSTFSLSIYCSAISSSVFLSSGITIPFSKFG